MINEKIKIAYNWIGPNGPIMNAEIPSILAFAGVTPGAHTDSHKFWGEGLWHSFFRKNPEFEISPAWPIDSSDKFIYPMTLTCRTPFSSYFQINDGLLEWGHALPSIIHHVRYSGGYFLIDISVEAWVEDERLLMIHSYFNHLKIPLNKIIYLTGCMNPDEIYSDFCQRHAIPESPECRINLISFPISQNFISISIEIEEKDNVPAIVYNPNYIPSKTFLSWNRRHRTHRAILAIAMHKEGLLPKSYLSMIPIDPDMGTGKFETSFSHTEAERFGITNDDIQQFTSLLPLVVDGETQINSMCSDIENKTRNFYTDSLLSIITETNFDNRELTLTEKSFKQFKQKHPFILVAPPHSLIALHKLGFKTFSEFWSEEYDNMKDSKERLAEIIRLCKEIAQWDNAKIIDFRKKVKYIVEHNYNQVKISSAVSSTNNILNIIRKYTP
jgi:hypothetical protein